jgi:hypothetical protein
MSASKLRRTLQQDEPDYEEIARQLDDKSLGVLADLARHADPLTASKATHLASLVPSMAATHVIRAAAERKEPTVRVATAASFSNLVELLATSDEGLADQLRWSGEPLFAMSDSTLQKLLEDPDPGVRKFASRSAGRMRETLDRPAPA